MSDIPKPADQPMRDRFVSEIDTNFALNCSAGSGKTRAISDRVASIARAVDGERRMAELVVVTFTKKAAEEMQVRARERLLDAAVPARVHQAFAKAFFGTIHAFAVSLLRAHGHLIGVPASFEVTDSADRLWLLFLQSPEWKSHRASNPLFARVLRHIPVKQILNMVSGWDATRSVPHVPSAPVTDFGPIYTYAPSRKLTPATARNIANFQAQAHAFETAWLSNSDEFYELPIPTCGGKDFIATSRTALTPVAEWLRSAATVLAGEIFLAFRDWRVRNGILTYDDQIALAVRLLESEAGRLAVRNRNLTVILDEAQDTDPEQFDLLLNCTLPASESGGWRDGVVPLRGHFCMVGDMQQSIYGERADLPTYRRVHEFLTSNGVGEALTFSVTFRLDQAVIDSCNRIFPNVLTGIDGQVAFVPLQGRPSVGQGQVLRIPFPRDGSKTDPEREADLIANFLAAQKPAGLRAANWGQVAILVPRTAWFSQLRQSLLRRGIRSVQLSQAEKNQDSPAYAWLTALCTALSDPREGFEIVGLLRELYGLSDRELALFCQGKGSVWQIAEPVDGTGPIPDALNELHRLMLRISGLPLRRAVAAIDCDVLRPRLRALPASEYGDLEAELDPLLTRASALESEGMDLRKFAEYLRARLGDKPADMASAPDCVNLLTCHKSKGLEYDCVVVPYLGRQISAAPMRYPRMVGERFTPARFAFDHDDFNAAEPQAAVSYRHELQRLIYVTLTRARQTLVLVDDTISEVPAYSMASALNGACLTDLPGTTTLPALPSPKHEKADALPAIDMAQAAVVASEHRLKVSPHDLAEEDTAANNLRKESGRLRSEHATIPLLYGIWWHDTFKGMPWAEGLSALQLHWAAAAAICPDIERAQDEWARFISSGLCGRILKHGAIRMAEASFISQAAAGHAIEGIMDLAVFHPEDGWLIVDWKTGINDSADNLANSYGQQVRVYRDSVAAFTGERATGVLYGTKSGAEVIIAD